MDKIRDFKVWLNVKWGYNGGLIEKETSLQFRTVPINSFLPCLVFSLIFTIAGVFILRRQPSHWYVATVCWVFAGVLLKKSKFGMFAMAMAFLILTIPVTYSFDKVEGNFIGTGPKNHDFSC